MTAHYVTRNTIVEEHNYLIEPPRWREQQQQDENEEEKVNEDGDLEIPSPRAEPILEEEDDGGKFQLHTFRFLIYAFPE